MEYKLSPSNLNLFMDCPRCFWLHMIKKIKRPMGPMSSIPIKMDSIIKHYFNRYREQGILPPIIVGQIEGKLALDMPKTLKLEMEDGITLWGRPDDYFELSDGSIVAFDHKTKSKEPEDVHRSYQLQLDFYSFLLKNLDYKTTDIGFLAYYYPDECDLHDGMPFNCTIVEIKTYPSKIKDLVKKALNVLNKDIPKVGKNCLYCKWTENTSKLDL